MFRRLSTGTEGQLLVLPSLVSIYLGASPSYGIAFDNDGERYVSIIYLKEGKPTRTRVSLQYFTDHHRKVKSSLSQGIKSLIDNENIPEVIKEELFNIKRKINENNKVLNL